MAINKVVYDGNTLIDLTGDTVTAETLAEGVTAHDKSGAPITGTLAAGGGDDRFAALVEGTITEAADEDITGIRAYLFFSYANLIRADFPTASYIGSNAFNNCRLLADASFPVAVQIRSSAFYSCSALTSVSIPAAKIIYESSFNRCIKLTNVNLPVASTIGSYAFAYCSALTALVLGRSSLCTLVRSNAFASTPIASGTGYIYVPSSLVASYKASTNWAYYSNQISAIEDSEFA